MLILKKIIKIVCNIKNKRVLHCSELQFEY